MGIRPLDAPVGVAADSDAGGPLGNTIDWGPRLRAGAAALAVGCALVLWWVAPGRDPNAQYTIDVVAFFGVLAGCLCLVHWRHGRQITELLKLHRQRVYHLISGLPDAVFDVDAQGVVRFANPAALTLLQQHEGQLVGLEFADLCMAPARHEVEAWMRQARASRPAPPGDLAIRVGCDDSNGLPVRGRISCHQTPLGLRFIVVLSDEREREQLARTQRLEAIGQLAAGIAHEVNTPIQFIGDNLGAIGDQVTGVRGAVDGYRKLLADTAAIEAMEEIDRAFDIEFVLGDLPVAVAEAQAGVDRVTQIVRAMRDFARVDADRIETYDLNAALQSTLTVARSEYKSVAQVVCDWGDLPPVTGFRGELNQVFLNLIVNAAHAIAATDRRPGAIEIGTRHLGPWIEVRIADNGCGIPEAIRDKVFDPFFTTKEVGKGTGQGLHVAHQVIQRHGGTIEVDSVDGGGTTFVLRVPVEVASAPQSLTSTQP